MELSVSVAWSFLYFFCLIPLGDLHNTQKPEYKPLDFKYHSYQDMVKFLKEISERYPNLTSLNSIGQSVKGKELWTLMVSSWQDDDNVPLGTPNVKIIGNIHGNEPVGKELILHLIEYLVTNYQVNNSLTQLLDTTRIYFLPCMNPDGLEIAQVTQCSMGKGRSNGNKVDLNRSFPDIFRENRIPQQPETRAIIEWMNRVSFVLSASLQGGVLAAIYPYENHDEDVSDFKPSISPDDDVFRNLASVYANSHPSMHKGLKCPSAGRKKKEAPAFRNGITNGAAWYRVTGGMQDYNYVAHGCMEITLEISCCKYPEHSQLIDLWNQNREALLIYAMQVHGGVKGVVTGVRTGHPIAGARLRILGRDVQFGTTPRGEFWRLLLPQRSPYRIEVQAAGYHRQVVPFVVPANYGRAVWLNITMKHQESDISVATVGRGSSRSELKNEMSSIATQTTAGCEQTAAISGRKEDVLSGTIVTPVGAPEISMTDNSKDTLKTLSLQAASAGSTHELSWLLLSVALGRVVLV